jgi:hypothetical protein
MPLRGSRMSQFSANGTLSKHCHPEPFFWAKDLPRCVGLARSVLALSREFWPKSRDAAIKSEIFREILRPEDGLRMTVLGTPGRLLPFRKTSP